MDSPAGPKQTICNKLLKRSAYGTFSRPPLHEGAESLVVLFVCMNMQAELVRQSEADRWRQLTINV